MDKGKQIQGTVWRGKKHPGALAGFLLPGLLGILVFYVLPFLGGLYYSVTDGSARLAYAGAANYVDVWRNRMFSLGLTNSFALSLLCVPPVWVFGFVLALALDRLKGGARLMRGSLLLPYVMPSSAVILIWLMAFDYGGALNRLLAALGAARVDFLSGSAVRLPVTLLFIWKNMGFAVIVYLSAMQAVPEELYEYARLEGAGFWRCAGKITLPHILPACFAVVVFEWLAAFKIFREVFFIGGAYPDASVYTLQNYMNNLFFKLRYQHVTAAAYLFACMMFALFGLIFLFERRAEKKLEG